MKTKDSCLDILNKGIYDVVTNESSILSDIEFFIERKKAEIKMLETAKEAFVTKKGLYNKTDNLHAILWNYTCAKTSFKFKR